MIKCCLLVSGVLSLFSARSQVMLEPTDVRVCPNSKDIVVIMCNESRRSVLQLRVDAPPMLSDTVFVSETNSIIEEPVPFESRPGSSTFQGINLTVHSVSNTSISASVTIDTSNYNLTGSHITVACGSTINPPTATIQNME